MQSTPSLPSIARALYNARTSHSSHSVSWGQIGSYGQPDPKCTSSQSPAIDGPGWYTSHSFQIGAQPFSESTRKSGIQKPNGLAQVLTAVSVSSGRIHS